MKMPFGKYKGTQVEYLTDEYLDWLVNNVQFRPDPDKLGSYVRAEIARRKNGGKAPEQPMQEHPGVIVWKKNRQRLMDLATFDNELRMILEVIDQAMGE